MSIHIVVKYAQYLLVIPNHCFPFISKDSCQYTKMGSSNVFSIPSDQLENNIIEIFKPIRSMLCERGSISNINQMLTENDYYLETEMDGERCQLHVQEKQFKYFSRNCKEDLTSIFGDSSTTGSYSPILHYHLGGKVESAIFDGEMMVWDRKSEIFLKKAEGCTAKFLKSTDESKIPCFCIFDLLYFNGESMIDKPYTERIRMLETIIKEQRGSLMLCHRIKLRDAAHFRECFNSAFDSNEEGVVIKQDDSKYLPGKREKSGWFKIKPDYANDMLNGIDLLIIGAFYNNKRTIVDSFLLAIMGKKAEDETNSDVFHAVCRIRNGFKRSQFAEILSRLEPHKREVNKTSPAPPGIKWDRAIPDFWYDPKHSIVLKIEASDLKITAIFQTYFTFRFPRVVDILWNTSYRDICSRYEFIRITLSYDFPVRKLPRRRQATKRPMATNVSNIPSTFTEIVPVDNLCEGLDFCIMNCDKKAHTVKELEAMVKRHGGNLVSYPNSKTYVVIAGNPNTINVQKLIKADYCKIAKPQWLVRALGNEQPIKKLKKFNSDDIHTTVEHFDEGSIDVPEVERQEENVRNVESVTNEPNATLNAFSASNTIEPTIVPEPIQPEVSDAGKEEINEHTCYGFAGVVANSPEINETALFRSCVAYFYQGDAWFVDFDFTLAESTFIIEGGTLSETPDGIQNLTHIFVANDEFNHDKLREFFKTLGKQSLENIRVMRYQWISDCAEQNKKLSDVDYLIQL